MDNKSYSSISQMKICICTGSETIPLRLITVPLTGGHHTQFIAMRCKRCGKIKPFPVQNYELALAENPSGLKSAMEEH